MRPIIEYEDIIYDGMPISLGEWVLRKRHATIICWGAYRHTETQPLLQEVGCAPLIEKRKIHKLTTFYKIKSGIYLTYLIKDYIPVTSEPCYTSGSVSHIPYIPCRLWNSQSFFPSTISLWNTLPQSMVDSQSTTVFKSIIKQPSVQSSDNTMYWQTRYKAL